MGSRAIVVICRDASVADRRFGSTREKRAASTPDGATFLYRRSMETALLAKVRSALDAAGLWRN